MKLRTGIQNKQKLSSTLRSWLPLLQCSLTELELKLQQYAEINPFMEVNSNQEVGFDEEDHEAEDGAAKEKEEEYDYFKKYEKKQSLTDTIEALTVSSKSLYDILYEQVTDTLFPTPVSKEIAHELIRHVNEEGFFEGDLEVISTKLGHTPESIERIRQRFQFFEPSGVGAKDLEECFIFQLGDYEMCNDTYGLLKEMASDIHNIGKFHKRPNFHEAIRIFKRLKNPPAIDFLQDSQQVVPDIFVMENGNNLEVSLNDDFYPEIVVEDAGFDRKIEFVKVKLKEARDLVDAISMRKATLYKLGLMIVEYQYDFFKGGEIKPMKLSDLSEELGRNASTISRAISNKYLACNRGVFPMKSFFSVSIGEDTSTKAIKDYLQKIIKEEDRKKPLSDQKLLGLIQENFQVKMVRRTITKYREQLEIPTSGERKRMYLLEQ